MTCIEIRDADDPRLAPYRDLKQSHLLEQSVSFIAEGRLLVQRLLASELSTESILCSDHCRSELQHLHESPIPVYVAPLTLVRRIVGFSFHRGMLACGRRPANPPLSQLVTPGTRRRVIVICPQVADPSNLAGVIRNCAAFGVDGLLLGTHSADAYARRVIRVSMGTVFQLPVRVAANLPADLESLRATLGFKMVATVLDPTAVALNEACRPDNLALLIGSEGDGLQPEWICWCDAQVTLPMQRHTDSLNLATATGVFLYHYTHVARPETAQVSF